MQMLIVGLSLQQLAEEVAEDGEPESDLGQLPGHHPLIKDGMSDEGLSQQLGCLTIIIILAEYECPIYKNVL